MSNGNKNLIKAKKTKNDEFYTQLPDIENELQHYKEQFRDKVVFCNCDNPFESNFFKYFAMNFNHLKLKKLIATCYKNSPIANTELSLFDYESPENKTTKSPHKIIITKVDDYNNDHKEDIADVEWLLRNKKNVLTRLKGDGDFRSEECIELLKQADIVVTNPPFSLFREYVAQLMEYKKKFLIMGNINALTYKEIFPLLKENKIWLGKSLHGGDIEFRVPDYYSLYAAGYRIDEYGHKFIRVTSVRWFTNLKVEKHKKNITLYKKYTPEEYPKYDNYNAIDVSKVKNIPYDYAGAMGVPITFIDKYNPEQFEIIAMGNSRGNFTPTKNYINPIKVRKDGTEVSAGNINGSLTINKKEKPRGRVYYKSDNSNYLIIPYVRFIIKRIGDTQ